MTVSAADAPPSAATFPPVRLWWLSPVVVSLVVAVAAITPAAVIGDDTFRTLWRSPKSVTGETLLLFGCGAAVLALGALLVITAAPAKTRLLVPWPGLSEPSLRLISTCSTILTGAALVGYIGFAYLAERSGLGLSALFSLSQLRDVGTIPGFTTLTQFGIPAVVASTIVMVHRFSGAELFKVVLLIGLGALRAFSGDERLAALELIGPCVVILATRFSVQHGFRRWLTQFMPFIAVAFVAAFFAVFEYSRSWKWYRDEVTTSYAEFAMNRLGGYYTTAINNGELILDHLSQADRLPFYTVEAIWTAPGIRQAGLYEKLGGYPRAEVAGDIDSPYMTVLRQFGNPEFNNYGGYAAGFSDYGRLGGTIYFFLAGVVAGFLYWAFREGKPSGLFLYPVVFLALVEMPRYMYWAEGRSTYAWIGLLVLVFLVSRSEAKHRQHDYPPSVPRIRRRLLHSLREPSG